jgi:hypothetical protein
MSPTSIPANASPSLVRWSATAGVFAAALLLAPLTATANPMAGHHHGRMTSAQRAESVEQRITRLHAQLQITPAQEVNWAPVAQAMRDNEAKMQAMISARAAEPAHQVNAVEDLKTYERFNQAHVDGLKTLIPSFEALYATMPDSQKHLADQVFRKFNHHA